MTALRILVIGSRDWPDQDAVWTALDKAVAEHSPADSVTVVHGASLGADEHADEWVAHQRYYHPARLVYLAPHLPWRARYGRMAGLIRDRQMVAAGAHICLAFLISGDQLAAHGARIAEAAGIPTVYYRRTTGGTA